MLTTRVVCLIHMPCGHWISLEAWGRSFRPCVPASLAGDHGVGPDSCGNTWSDKMGCRDFGVAYCTSLPFSALLLLRRKQKTAAQRVCSVPLFFIFVIDSAWKKGPGHSKQRQSRGNPSYLPRYFHRNLVQLHGAGQGSGYTRLK